MWSFYLFLLLNFFVLQVLSFRGLIPLATSEYIREFFVKNSERFDFIIYDSNDESFNEIANEIVKLSSGNDFPFELIRMTASGKVFEILRSAVLLFDTFESYLDFHLRTHLYNDYQRDFHFLVYVHNLEDKTAITNERFYLLHYEMFLDHRHSDDLRLTSFVTLQQPNCRAIHEIEVNRFSAKTRKWENSEFFLKRFENLNGCELVVSVPYPMPPITGVDFDSDGKFVTSWGYGVRFWEEISKQLNFKMHQNPYNVHTGRHYNEALAENDVSSLTIATRPIRHISFTPGVQSSQPFTTGEDLILISRNVPYTQLEKLFLPFDEDVWVWLIVTLSAAVATIFILRFATKRVQQFVFGSKVQTPMINLLYVNFNFVFLFFFRKLLFLNFSFSIYFPEMLHSVADRSFYPVGTSLASSSCCSSYSASSCALVTRESSSSS